MENMKKILIVMFGMGCGGAEKSLISCLNLLPRDRWKIDLLVASPHGMYMKQIPEYVGLIDDLYEFENLLTPMNERRKKIASISDLFNQIRWKIAYPAEKKNRQLSFTELRWDLWGKYIPSLEKEYDVALAYMNGIVTYYTMDKVKARKKAVWIHNEFEKMGYSAEFHRNYYARADKVVTISQDCVDSFLRVYPEYRDKTIVLENISSGQAIRELAREIPAGDPFFGFDGLKIVSVGRLMEQKGYDYAIEAAALLKKRGVRFLWYVLGEGELRSTLETRITQYGLQEDVKLVGIKDNPYPYVGACDIFAQTSRYEGKSIAVDEAKILCKPILLTDYVTAKGSIQNGKNGMIVEMTSEAIAEGLYTLSQHIELREQFINRLRNEKNSNEDEIEKYIDLIEKMLEEK